MTEQTKTLIIVALTLYPLMIFSAQDTGLKKLGENYISIIDLQNVGKYVDIVYAVILNLVKF